MQMHFLQSSFWRSCIGIVCVNSVNAYCHGGDVLSGWKKAVIRKQIKYKDAGDGGRKRKTEEQSPLILQKTSDVSQKADLEKTMGGYCAECNPDKEPDIRGRIRCRFLKKETAVKCRRDCEEGADVFGIGRKCKSTFDRFC